MKTYFGYLLLVFGGVLCEDDETFYFTQHPEDLTVAEGQPVKLECKASSPAGVEYSWERGGETLKNTSRRHQTGHSLVFRRAVHAEDPGDYTCIATNSTTGYSISSRTAALAVLWVGENVTVSVIGHKPLASGADLKLHCDAEGSEPLSIQWFRNGDGLKNTTGKIEHHGKSLKVIDVTPLDNGIYRCIATNSAATVSSLNTVSLSIPGEQWAQIEVEPHDTIANIGSTAVFNCLYKHADVIEWFFKQTGPLENNTEYIAFSNGSLVIKNVSERNEGLYSCVGIRGESTAVPQVYSAYLHTAFLNDINEKTIEPEGGPVRVVGEGDEFELGCISPAGRPKPLVSWEGPRHPILYDNILKLNSVTKKMSGNYTCSISNVAGSRQIGIQLVVTTLPQITQNPLPVLVDEGGDALFRCEYSGTTKHTKIQWYKDKVQVRGPRFIEKKGFLNITSVQPSDRGDYYCQIETEPFAPVYSRPATLSVKEKLKFSPRPVNKNLELGTVKKVHCKAQGSTPPIVKWFKDGDNGDFPDHISDINGTLHFNTVQADDKGRYTCIATNPQGVINATIDIDVVVGPKFTVLPNNPTNAYEGALVLMDCVAEGDPKPAIHWDKNSAMGNLDKTSRFQVLENGSLLIDDVRATDEGKYGCTAGNSGGLKRYEVSLVVRGADGYRVGDNENGMGGGTMLSKTVAITLGAAGAYMVLVIGLMAYCRCRSRRNKLALQQAQQPDSLLGQAEGGSIGDGKPKCNGDAAHSDGDITAHSQGSSHSKQSYGKLTVTRDDLSNSMVLGKGIFGEVSLAQVKNLPENENVVMIKALQETRDEYALQEFKRELDLFGRLDHPNIAKLVGLCRAADPHLMILQYTDWGDLKQMLMATKKERKDKPKPPELTLNIILSLVHQLALGMEHISNHRLVHKDLAARNCLVSSDLTLKISLSALAKDTYNKEYFMYRNKYLPIRWLPHEVIAEDDYSCKSDVYSFGATSWEIFTRGELPFASQTDEEVLNMVESGSLTWTHPKSSPEDMNILLDKCWSSSPTERPTFSHIALKIGDIMAELNKS